MDATKPDEVKDAREIVKETVEDDGLTLLINNMEVRQMQPFPYISRENLLYHFTVNTVGPIMVFQELYSSLLKAAGRKDVNSVMSVNRAMVLNITSISGSITRTGKDSVHDLEVPGYKISKAALNMAMRNFAENVKGESILVIMMCPGCEIKDAGTDQEEVGVEESVSNILQTLPKLNEKHQGTYIDRNGNEYLF
ncbi:C-factor-like [Stegodyphus dumicola]|uniref:C-factor-like n=1 Tax=Stegodyphus dumicola TaxID=202533 RepID=UPI0015A84344|nr:C-factor-like [Stegodyphus dumicola]